jgi:predicted aldo/keto reductase-like oxidoreductase
MQQQAAIMKRRTFLKTAAGAAGAVALCGELAVAEAVASRPVRVNGMPRRTLGRTGWKVSVVGYSGFALKNAGQAEATASVRHALERGLNYLDVAPAYDSGSCEMRMGAALAGVPRDSYFLACKTKMRDAAGAREELEQSLRRLKTDHFDVYQLHHLVKPDEVKKALGPGGALEEILRAKQEGKVRAIGFSAHTTKAALQALDGFNFDTVMFPINYVEYYTRDFGREVMAKANEKGAAVLSIKTMNAGAWPPNVERTRKWWYRSLEDQELIDLAFRWTLSLPGVVLGFSPSWLDLQAKALEAARAYRPASEEDIHRVQQLAAGNGSIFKREEDSVAHARSPHDFYPGNPHGCCLA